MKRMWSYKEKYKNNELMQLFEIQLVAPLMVKQMVEKSVLNIKIYHCAEEGDLKTRMNSNT